MNNLSRRLSNSAILFFGLVGLSHLFFAVWLFRSFSLNVNELSGFFDAYGPILPFSAGWINLIKPLSLEGFRVIVFLVGLLEFAAAVAMWKKYKTGYFIWLFLIILTLVNTLRLVLGVKDLFLVGGQIQIIWTVFYLFGFLLVRVKTAS